MNKEIIVSILLAGAVVFGSIVLLSRSIKPLSNNTTQQSTEKESNIEPLSKKLAPRKDDPAKAEYTNAFLLEKSLTQKRNALKEQKAQQ